MISHLLRRQRYNLVNALSTRPAVYYGIRRLVGQLDDLCIGPETEIVIEGYGRSANSTTVYGFIDRQGRNVQIAHHKHHVAQLLVATERGLPAVMLIRRPFDAALSNLALMAEGRVRAGQDSSALSIGPTETLRSWRSFYATAARILDDVVIAPFEEVTHDIGPMIDAVNQRFGTEFRSAPAAATKHSDSLGWHARPNPLRNGIKADLKNQFDAEWSRSRRFRSLLEECDAIRAGILRHHERRR